MTQFLSIKTGGEALAWVWPLCHALGYFGGVELVYIYKGRQMIMPKAPQGMGAKPLEKGGCEGLKMADLVKTLQDNNI